MIDIIMHGCNGKMGQVIVNTVKADPDARIVAGIDLFDEGKNDFPVYKSLLDCKEKADIIIDFTIAKAVPKLIKDAKKIKTPLIVATTALTPDNLAELKQAGKTIPVFQAANMSLGVNLMMNLLKKTASVLGSDYDIELIEKHHNQKIDAPSGTALALANAINEVFQNDKEYIYGRHSKTERRQKKEIGIHAIRAGNYPGEHQVIFAGSDEVIQLTHMAYSKKVFASGVLNVAKYMQNRPVGFYTMNDYLTNDSAVTSITASDDEALITLSNIPLASGILANIFQKFGEENIVLDMVSQVIPQNNSVTVSFSLPIDDIKKAETIINSIFSVDYMISKNVTKVRIEGDGMEYQSGITAKVLKSLVEANITVKAITTSETEILLIVDNNKSKETIKVLKETFPR